MLKFAAAGTTGLLLPLGNNAWPRAAPRMARARWFLFLPGAVDGLNVVAPYAEEAYYDYRRSIALDPPGSADGLLDLDGHFGLHPALAPLMPLMPLWNQRQLAFVHACGSPDSARSHFEAQAYMETATPGVPTTRTGWLNRLTLRYGRAADMVVFGPIQPLITRGPAPTATFPVGRGATHLKPLAEGLATFWQSLGPLWQDSVVLVISEFGQTARENGDRGTDHAHGNVHWVLGGKIHGGRIYGDWRGLAEHALPQQWDLPVTTDFLSVIDLVLHKYLATNKAIRHHVLPDFTPDYQHIQVLFA
ncbi:MAG: DUF1501 domain-containing protein [Gammaproteobacteria bacterium]